MIPLRVRGGERIRQRNRVLQHRVERQAARLNQIGERAPLDQFHREEDTSVDLINRVDRDDVRVVEGGDGSRFTVEPRDGVGIGFDAGRQHFQRDVPLELRVAGTIDVAHAAAAKQHHGFVSAEARAHGNGHP